ncbi:c-type cytochrome [Caenimonas sp. SL110]|uniref:c-type cytochrome n=1 Tax=Caenimonas sp. SL110 TaxID=1450524 RepID=UPI000652C1F0|nr:c-type cytochrome [Caenimonas sp. SL110]
MTAVLRALVFAVGLMSFGAQAQDNPRYPGIGRAATPAEVTAWDIDVRPDFKGLPAGSGSVAKGQQVWETKCASCHGVFGESNQVFNPLIGGTTAQDITTGKVATLQRTDYPGRTTLMKLQNVSTLWDYIRRAMPWNEPKSLSTEEVYAVTAYMLNLADVLPADFTLSNTNMGEVQQRIPNRNGFTTQHGLWPGREFGGTGKPDTRARPCMKDCPDPGKLALAPDFARGSHGDLSQQVRLVGPQRSASARIADVQTAAVSPSPASPSPASPSRIDVPLALLQKHSCNACHAASTKLVGPSWADIGQKHKGKADYLEGKIRSGGSGIWGAIPMPPQSISKEEAGQIAAWLAQGISR